MNPIVRNIALFIAGSTLAVLFTFSGIANYFLGTGIRTVEQVAGDQPAVTGFHIQTSNPDVKQNKKLEKSRASYSSTSSAATMSAQRITQLQRAIESASPTALAAIKTSQLDQHQDYETKILPALKTTALNTMLTKFNSYDWEDWRNETRREPSEARAFVDDVLLVNKPLGIFLETTAHLLSGLYHTTTQGMVFKEEVYLNDLIDRAEEVMKNRVEKALPGRAFLSNRTLQDPIFRRQFETERSRLVAQFVAANRAEVSLLLPLINSVEPRYAASEFIAELQHFGLFVATRASVALRQEILDAEQSSGFLRRYAENFPELKKTLAQVYVIGSIDALDRSDPANAILYLNDSRTFVDGLPEQTMVEELLRTSQGAPSVETQAATSGTSLTYTGKPQHAEPNWAPWLVRIPLLLLLGMILVRISQFFLNRSLPHAIEQRKPSKSAQLRIVHAPDDPYTINDEVFDDEIEVAPRKKNARKG
ncbi:hypothetical protein JNK13_09145 [bacterium]|nr:hypothetical protein [bacterium]